MFKKFIVIGFILIGCVGCIPTIDIDNHEEFKILTRSINDDNIYEYKITTMDPEIDYIVFTSKELYNIGDVFTIKLIRKEE